MEEREIAEEFWKLKAFELEFEATDIEEWFLKLKKKILKKAEL